MSDRFTTVTRELLYEQVWSTPMMRLAKDYGVSGNALAKTCHKLGVPVPPRGHWAKLLHGKRTPPRPPLPPAKDGVPGRATVSRSAPASTPRPPEPVIESCVASLAVEGIKVAAQLLRPHPAVVAPRGGGGLTLPMRVSERSMPRARLIMDALVKALEGRGHQVTAAGATIEGEVVPIVITEKDDRSPHVATAAELARERAYSWEKPPAWDYVPSGKLSIHSDCHLWDRRDVRRRWSDGRFDLEDMLDDVPLGLVSVGVALRQQTDERRAQQERWAEEARQRAGRERLARLEAAKDDDILARARELAESEQLRRLIAAVELRAADDGGQPSTDLQAWLMRAASLADRLDPNAEGLQHMLARHEEESLKEADAMRRRDL